MFRTVMMASAVAAGLSAPVSAATVDLELYLLNDVSGSVDSTDFNTFIQGYVDAFNSSEVVEAIEEGAIGAISVAFGFFASNHATSIPFTVIDSAASAQAFANQIAALSRPSVGISTSPTNGINGAVPEFAFNGTRQVIDITMDGGENVNCGSGTSICAPLQNASAAAQNAGIDAINALLINDRNFFGDDPEDAVQATPYAENNILFGDSFSVLIEGFDDFGDAIQAKLVREIVIDPDPVDPNPIPLPATAWMLIAGLGGLAAMRRKSL